MTHRHRLPNRRACETQTIIFGERCTQYFISSGQYDDGSVAEIFIDATRDGGDAVVLADDGAVIASIALQYGCQLEVLCKSVTRLHDGSPASPLGAALDVVMSLNK